MGLEIHSEPLASLAQAWPVECDGRQVGEITSAVYSPDLDKNIGMAMVGIECAEPGTQLMIDMGDGRTQATVSSMPFIDNRAKYLHGARNQ